MISWVIHITSRSALIKFWAFKLVEAHWVCHMLDEASTLLTVVEDKLVMLLWSTSNSITRKAVIHPFARRANKTFCQRLWLYNFEDMEMAWIWSFYKHCKFHAHLSSSLSPKARSIKGWTNDWTKKFLTQDPM